MFNFLQMVQPNDIFEVDYIKLIDFIRDLTWYDFMHEGSMHQCYDFDEYFIKNLLTFELQNLIKRHGAVVLSEQ